MEYSTRETPAEVLKNVTAISHNVLYEQVALSRRASLSIDDQQRVADARQLLVRQAEDNGDIRQYEQFYVQASQQKNAFSDHRQEQFIPAYVRLLVSGMSFKGCEAVARGQLARVCAGQYAPLAIQVLMQECFERDEPVEKWLKAFAPMPDLYVQGALTYHSFIPEAQRAKDPSTEIIKKLAADISDQAPSDVLCLGNTKVIQYIAPLLEVVAQPYCGSPRLAVELAKTFYDNDHIDYNDVARVGLVVFDSPLLTAHMDEQAITAERIYREACEGFSTAQCQLRDTFWYASRQFTMPVPKFMDYVYGSHPQPDYAFANAMQRYLKHGMIDASAACLSNIHTPCMWANAALEYTSFSTSGVTLSKEDRWMDSVIGDGKSRVRPFVEALTELNHGAAAAELIKLLAHPPDPHFAPFFMHAATKLILRDRQVGERFCLDVIHLAMNNRQFSLVHAMADLGMQQGYVSVAQRYAQDFLYNQHHNYHEWRMHAAITTARRVRRLKKTIKT